MVTLIPIDTKKPSRMDKVSKFIKIYESLDWFGSEMRSRIRIKIKIARKHLHHNDISNLVNGNTNSHCNLPTLLLWTKYPILLKYMNLWTDSDRKWGLESESKSLIWRKHRNHKDIANSVNGNTNSLWHKKPSRMDKVSNLIKIFVSLDWFGYEIRSRIRIKIENWKKTSASYGYIQFSEW